MEGPRPARLGRVEHTRRRRTWAAAVETALIIALAGLVLFKGAPAMAGIASGIAGMMMALTRL